MKYIHCYPSAIKAVGIVITRGGRAVGNSAFTKKLNDEFCLFFTDMTYVPGQFIPYIFFATKPQAAIFQDGRLKSLGAR